MSVRLRIELQYGINAVGCVDSDAAIAAMPGDGDPAQAEGDAQRRDVEQRSNAAGQISSYKADRCCLDQTTADQWPESEIVQAEQSAAHSAA